MGVERYNFGMAVRLEADAVGSPGQRRFRLLAQSSRGTAWLWLEKEQLQALAMAVEEMLGGMPTLWSLSRVSAGQAAASAGTLAPPTLEVKVGQLGLGFDEERRRFVLQAHEEEADPEGEPAFACWVLRPQLEALTRQIYEVVAAGRPRCPLCHVPLTDEPHSCPGHNGHSP